jgi:hypothetical protein
MLLGTQTYTKNGTTKKPVISKSKVDLQLDGRRGGVVPASPAGPMPGGGATGHVG